MAKSKKKVEESEVDLSTGDVLTGDSQNLAIPTELEYLDEIKVANVVTFMRNNGFGDSAKGFRDSPSERKVILDYVISTMQGVGKKATVTDLLQML